MSFLAALLVAFVVHECGHALVARGLGFEVRRHARWYCVGIAFAAEAEHWTERRRLLIYAYGPAFSALLALIAAGAGLSELATVSLAVGASQLLPIPGSDGWKIGAALKRAVTERSVA